MRESRQFTHDRKDPTQDYSRDDFKACFHSWGKGMPARSDDYVRLKANHFMIIEDAIDELTELRPNLFTEWYVRNHHRYLRMREIERRVAIRLASCFFEDLHHGRITIN